MMMMIIVVVVVMVVSMMVKLRGVNKLALYSLMDIN